MSDEIVQFRCSKVRLFRMVPSGTGENTRWEEKGQGTLSIMHGQSGKTRMIMKTEPKAGKSSAMSETLLNQLVMPRANLVPASSEDGSDNRAYTFESDDYATNSLVSGVWALRFKTADLATSFAEQYKRAQDSNAAMYGKDLGAGGGAGGEAAGAGASFASASSTASTVDTGSTTASARGEESARSIGDGGAGASGGAGGGGGGKGGGGGTSGGGGGGWGALGLQLLGATAVAAVVGGLVYAAYPPSRGAIDRALRSAADALRDARKRVEAALGGAVKK